MPWLTPDSIPEEGDCRPLFIPADSVWLALVSGALTELTKPYNWQQFGSLTVQQTVDKMQDIINSYYDTACATCTTPGGYRVTRISSSGHLQQLDASGEWTDATDDYVIPSPTARTEGTPPDQNCLAAKNAVNVLEQLYESLSASFASELSTDEAITAFIAALVAIVGFEFAPITWSIAAGGFVFFEALFHALAYITADLWTEDFSKQFECLLLSCATNTAGVVTFDWDCVNAALLAQANSMGLSELQMRLYVQIGFIMHFIGGVDGLNLAARTTDITNDDCSFCPVEWCVEWALTDASDLNGLTLSAGTWVMGDGYSGENVRLYAESLGSLRVTHVEMTYSCDGFDTGSDGQTSIQLYDPDIVEITRVVRTNVGAHIVYSWNGDALMGEIDFVAGTQNVDFTFKMEHLLIRGFDTPPMIGTVC
jgi:hypothetical protein